MVTENRFATLVMKDLIEHASDIFDVCGVVAHLTATDCGGIGGTTAGAGLPRNRCA